MISISNRSYKDHLGRTINGGMPIGNQGDEGTYTCTYTMYTGVLLSDAVPVQFTQGTPGQITLMGVEGGWNSLGIVAGDTITINATSFDGSTTMTGTTLVNVVNGNVLTVGGIIASFMASSGRIYVNKTLQAVEVDFNLVPQDVDTNTASFIDNTTVKLSNNNISSLAVGASATLQQIGDKSGGIIRSANIKRIADGSMSGGIVTKRYDIEIKFVWWGLLSKWGENYFQDVLTVTPLEKVTFYPLFNNPSSFLTTYFKAVGDGNSGFRNENFNQNPTPFTISSCIWKDDNANVMTAYDFSKNSNFEITLSTTAGFGTNFGLIFFNDIQDSDLFSATISNGIGQFSHDRLTLFGEKATLTATTGQSLTSALGRNGEQYQITGISISITGTVATIKGKIEPNQAFIDYFSDNNNVNRRFALLVRSEGSTIPANNYSTTVNSLAWNGEGEISPIILGSYPMTTEILDHVNFPAVKDYPVIIEDDIRLNNSLLFPKGQKHTNLRFAPIALNSVTGDWFALETYDFAITVPVLPDGTQPIDISVPTYYSSLFPQTCPNINMKVVRDPSQDTSDEYGISMVLGNLVRWEKWLQQFNVDLDFYSDANKDWRNYQAGNWGVSLMVETTVEGVGTYRNIDPMPFENYDHNEDLTCTFEFERLDGTPINNPLIGEVVKVRAIFEDVTDVDFVRHWGMITVEPFEASPRYVISSYYNHGVQPSNPLSPTITGGDKLEVTGWGTDIVTMECIFDPNKIDTTKGVSFTARVQGDLAQGMRHKKSFKLVQLPYKPSDQGKDGRCCDCAPELKLASVDSNELIKNDIISHVHKLTDEDETVTFKIYKDGVLLSNYAVQWAFPHDPNARAITYNVRDYLINYGEGCYEVKKEINPAGIDMEISLGKYEIRPFTTANAEGTTRILYQNDFVTQFEENGVLSTINYADSGFEDSYRFRGMFGWWQPNVSSVSHYSNVRENRTATIISKEKYTLKMFEATDCMRRRLHKIVIHASVYRMSDHNRTNPDQRMIITNCILDANSPEDIDYFPGSRIMGITLPLAVQNENSVSRFGGTNRLPLGVTSILQTIGASEVIDPNNCLPSSLTVVNSLGATVDSVTVASGSTGTANAPDGTVTIKDLSGNVVATITTASGGSTEYTLSAALGATVFLKRTSDGTTFESQLVPSGAVTAIFVDDSIVTLRNSEGVFLGNNNIKPESSSDIIAPDVTINFETESGQPAWSDTIPAGVTKTITIPDGVPAAGWYRPLEWLKQPAIDDENVIWELMAVYPGDQNPYTNNLQATGGVTIEFYTDRDTDSPFYTTTTNNNTLIDYNDCLPSTEFRNYRQCWVKSYPTVNGNNWGTISFGTAHTVYGVYSSQILERIISCNSAHPMLSTNFSMGIGGGNPFLVENLEFRNKFCLINWYEALYYTYSLRRIWSENYGEITGGGSSCRGMFTQSRIQDQPINIALKPTISYFCYNSSNINEAIIDFSTTTGLQGNEFNGVSLQRIIGLNMGNLTGTVGNLNNIGTYYIELHGYRLGHALNGNAMRGEEVFKAWVDSLGNASGTQTITVSTLQFNSFGGLGSYVDDEVDAKGFTLMVV